VVLNKDLGDVRLRVIILNNADVALPLRGLILLRVRELILAGTPVVESAVELAVVDFGAVVRELLGESGRERPVQNSGHGGAVGGHNGFDVFRVARAAFDLKRGDARSHRANAAHRRARRRSAE